VLQSGRVVPRFRQGNIANTPNKLADLSLQFASRQNVGSSWQSTKTGVNQREAVWRPRQHYKPAIEELDTVRLKVGLQYFQTYYPVGTEGVAVHRHGNGEAFEVEFFEPEPAVVTLSRADLELLSRAP
jgi:hypothetical protein